MEYDIVRVETNLNELTYRVDSQLSELAAISNDTVTSVDSLVGRVDAIEANTEDLQTRVKYYVADAISGFTKDLLSEIADMFHDHIVKNQIDPMSDEDFYNRVQSLITKRVV